jgi:hypothetical protein
MVHQLVGVVPGKVVVAVVVGVVLLVEDINKEEEVVIKMRID